MKKLLSAQKKYVVDSKQQLVSGNLPESDRAYLTKKIALRETSISELEQKVKTLEVVVRKKGGPIKQLPWLHKEEASNKPKRKSAKKRNKRPKKN